MDEALERTNKIVQENYELFEEFFIGGARFAFSISNENKKEYLKKHHETIIKNFL